MTQAAWELSRPVRRQLIETVRSGECGALCASTAAMERFDEERRVAAKSTIWNTGCKSWYLDQDGLPTA
ncbi:MAG: hypothetical protein P8R42_13745 [Candidatus Binatia bacterium]|nr:hypothetical protein [Candidatus Binatia bacterium]